MRLRMRRHAAKRPSLEITYSRYWLRVLGRVSSSLEARSENFAARRGSLIRRETLTKSSRSPIGSPVGVSDRVSDTEAATHKASNEGLEFVLIGKTRHEEEIYSNLKETAKVIAKFRCMVCCLSIHFIFLFGLGISYIWLLSFTYAMH